MALTVDASVAVKWVILEPDHVRALALLASAPRVCAPDLLFAEVTNILWKKRRNSEITSDQHVQACRDLPGYVSDVTPCEALMARAAELSVKLAHPAYDCFYIACAERHEAPLVTDDRRLIDAAARAGFARHVTPLHA
jgi:predicted nucleic acid-binding protein